MITIAIMNQKGGVGKTTSALCIAEALALKKKKVLCIDMEPQHNFSNTKRINSSGLSVMNILRADATADEVIQHADHFDVIPGSNALSAVDSLISDVGKEYRLREALDPVKDRYDYCIIDTPPALGTISINAITACDYVIIPAASEVYSLDGIGQIYNTFQTVWKYCNKDFKILGILMIKYKKNLRHTRQAVASVERVAEAIGTKVFNAKIRECVSVAESQTHRMSLFEYDRNCTSARDYWNLTDEILQEVE